MIRFATFMLLAIASPAITAPVVTAPPCTTSLPFRVALRQADIDRLCVKPARLTPTPKKIRRERK